VTASGRAPSFQGITVVLVGGHCVSGRLIADSNERAAGLGLM
jgi:hypothetical protein